MKLRIDLDTDNDAFQVNFEGELRRILNTVAQYFSQNRYVHDKPIDLRDANGNTCGKAWLEYDGFGDDNEEETS